MFERLKERFEHVYNMTRLRLKPFLHRWTTGDMKDVLSSAGFGEIVHASDTVYAGQSMLVFSVFGVGPNKYRLLRRYFRIELTRGL
jgi:hypothetical protein